MPSSKSTVAVIKTSPSTVLQDYAKVMHLAGYENALSKAKETLLKINLSWSLFYPSCSTQPWQLEGVLKTMLQDGYKKEKIHAVENKTVVTNPWKGAKGNKWLPVLERHGLNFEPLTETAWVSYKPKHEMLALDHIFPDGHKIPKMFIGKNVVHLPTVKTHGHTMMTGAMKNAFGGLITEQRHHCHKMIHEVLVDLLQIQKEIHPGIFAVMDGTVAGDGAGPRTMIPVVKNVLLASEDQVAIDAVAAKMMGYDPLSIPFIKIAHDRGLGCGDVGQLDIKGIGKAELDKTNWHFATKKSPVIFWDQMFRKGALNFVEPWLFHTGLFQMCVFASAFYHDKIWYNLVGRQRINKFLGTEWGGLWQRY